MTFLYTSTLITLIAFLGLSFTYLFYDHGEPMVVTYYQHNDPKWAETDLPYKLSCEVDVERGSRAFYLIRQHFLTFAEYAETISGDKVFEVHDGEDVWFIYAEKGTLKTYAASELSDNFRFIQFSDTMQHLRNNVERAIAENPSDSHRACKAGIVADSFEVY